MLNMLPNAMIQKLSSQELNNILIDAKNKISKIGNDVNKVKEIASKKLNIIRNIQEYSLNELLAIKSKTGYNNKDRIVFAADEIYGTYEQFGITIHPKFTTAPINIFNFITAFGPIFKNNATVTINGVAKQEYADMLKHDAASDKMPFFDEFISDKITIEITVNAGELVGNSSFNIIELDPLIPGSFDITKLEIYEMSSYLTGQQIPDKTAYDSEQGVRLDNAGSCRIILDRKYNLYKMIIEAIVKYKNNAGRYPFGIKHLYLLNAELDTESQVVCRVRRNDYIDYIFDDVTLLSQDGEISTTLTELGAKAYLGYTNGILEYELPISTGLIPQQLTHNTKEFYLALPVKQALTALTFSKIATR